MQYEELPDPRRLVALCEEGAALGHASSAVALANLARLGNRDVVTRYNLRGVIEGARQVTKLTTGAPVAVRQPVYGPRAIEAVFGDHPLGRPIGGNPASIGAVSRDAVWAHYQKNYRPQDLVVTVAGAVDHDELVTATIAALDRAGWPSDAPASPVPRRSDVAHPAAPLAPGVAKRLKNIILRLDDCHKLTWDAVQDANDRACNRQMSLNEQASNERLLFEVQGGVLGHLEETATSSTATAKDIAGVATVQKDLA